MKSIVIRPIQYADAEAASVMLSALAAHHGDESKTNAASLVRYGIGKERLSTVWIALLGNNTVAMSITYDWMNFVRGYRVRHIDALYVEQLHRRHGVGSAVIKHLVTDASATGCQRVTVSATITNFEADAFYRKLGFELKEHKSNQYQIEI